MIKVIYTAVTIFLTKQFHKTSYNIPFQSWKIIICLFSFGRVPNSWPSMACPTSTFCNGRANTVFIVQGVGTLCVYMLALFLFFFSLDAYVWGFVYLFVCFPFFSSAKPRILFLSPNLKSCHIFFLFFLKKKFLEGISVPCVTQN